MMNVGDRSDTFSHTAQTQHFQCESYMECFYKQGAPNIDPNIVITSVVVEEHPNEETPNSWKP